MMSFFGNLLAKLGGGALKSPREFTLEAAEIVRKKRPGTEVEILQDLEIRLEGGIQCFLHNAYEIYRVNPGARKAILGDIISSGLEAMDRSGSKVRKERIVPVIKHRDWIEESRRSLARDATGEIPLPVHEVYNEELSICYAEDSEKGVRYLQDKDLEEAGIEPGSLRELAVSNLKQLLPDVRAEGGGGLYMMAADGTYESSLILLDEIWTSGRLDLRGEIVVAIPSRELLLVTGTGHEEGLERLREVAEEVHRDGAPYRLSEDLFVYRGGKFVVLR